MSAGAATSAGKWESPWFDASAFVAGLALAWFGHWQTKDLVWSLWLSSLLVGYAMILWMIFSPGLFIACHAWRDRDGVEATAVSRLVGLGGIYLVGALFLLGFFTFHFGMFHFVHSAFLSAFFPMTEGATRNGMPGLALYRAVFLAYWPFVLVAAVAERQAFRWLGGNDTAPANTSVAPADIAARKAKNALGGATANMMTPYRNVIRLHLLIFFFAFASFTHVENFAVYAVVYAVYFFPWRLLRRRAGGAVSP
ncbi:MAG: hypothetical protein JWM32_2162 [Verrucomicrobia bacterium]|nr:hypothetical protein [Verrucomicrobiota bacterium]